MAMICMYLIVEFTYMYAIIKEKLQRTRVIDDLRTSHDYIVVFISEILKFVFK